MPALWKSVFWRKIVKFKFTTMSNSMKFLTSKHLQNKVQLPPNCTMLINIWKREDDCKCAHIWQWCVLIHFCLRRAEMRRKKYLSIWLNSFLYCLISLKFGILVIVNVSISSTRRPVSLNVLFVSQQLRMECNYSCLLKIWKGRSIELELDLIGTQSRNLLLKPWFESGIFLRSGKVNKSCSCRPECRKVVSCLA